jgi:hypothetical protein
MALALQFADPARAYGLFQAVLGAMTVWMIGRLATGLAGWRVGVLTGWGAALYPAHVLLVGQPHSTVLNAFCLAALLLACWRVRERPTVGRALVAGALLGLFALSRPQIVLFVPVIAGWFWLNGVRGTKFWRATSVLVLVAGVVILPWCIRNTVLLGRPTFISTNGGVTFWNGNNPFTTGSAHDVFADKLAAFRGQDERDPSLPDVYEHPPPYPFPPEMEARLGTMSELELDRAAYGAGLDYIRQHPADWLRLEKQKLVSLWWFRPNLGANPLYQARWTVLYMLQYPLVLFAAVVGVIISMWGAPGSWRRYALVYAILAFYTLVHLAFNVLTRYRWEIELLLLIFAALALETTWHKLRSKGRTT